MSGYILLILLGLLGVVFWRAWARRSFDQLLDDDHHFHLHVLATSKAHPKGGRWSDHRRWMAEQELH